MATSNNLGMYLPTREDYISVKRDISDNLAILDAAAGNMDILVNGNTASVNVTSGQFVTVLNSTITGVTDGIYKAVANVAAGVPFVAANLTSPTSGALNELVEQIEDINSNITNILTAKNVSTGITGVTSYKAGCVVNTQIRITTSISSGSGSWISLGTLPSSLRPKNELHFIGFDDLASDREGGLLQMRIQTSGKISAYLYAGESARPNANITYFT